MSTTDDNSAALQRENERLAREVAQLRAQLEESQETLRAIREGEVDALVVSGPQGERVFTLQSAEQPYRLLIEQMREGALMLVRDGAIHYANAAFADMVGRPLEQVIGSAMQHYVAPTDRPLFDALLHQTQSGTARGEVSLCAADGRLLPVYLGLSTIVVNGVSSICLVATDLTEQKRTQQVLASEEMHRVFFDLAAVGMAYVTPDGRIVKANEKYAEITGYTRAELLGMPVLDLTHPDDRDFERQMFELYARDERPVYRAEKRYLRKDGAICWVAVTARMVHEANGRPRYSIGIVEDITEHKRAEEAVRESERLYRAIGESINYGIWVCDAQGRNTYTSDSLLKLVGVSREQCADFGWGSVLHPDDAEATIAAWKECVRTGGTWYREHRYRGADGHWHPILARGVPIRNERGEVTAWAGINLDISQLKQAEQNLAAAKLSAEQAKAAAEHASKAKDHFLAVLSHELRNPLNPVLATAAMLRADPRFDADTREQLEVICRNVALEARLIDDLLDVTRIERGKVELDCRPIELGNVIRRAVEVCQPDIEARKLHFGVDIPDGPLLVNADVARLQQVFWNLLRNAVKFTPRGGCVGIRCRRDGDGFVIAEVTDSGVGLEPDAFGRIFNAFEQAERSITQKFGGLGLGLTISKAMVEMHGGHIEVHSPGKGQGATFTVRLPLLPADIAVTAAPRTAESPRPNMPLRRLRILLVEDHGDTARIMRRLLSLEGHEVEHAADVATAVALAEQQTFDLLLSDLGLPDGSGLDLMRALRAKGIQVPAIALSGYGQETDIQQSREAGFVAHLTKPVNIPKLEEAMAKIVGDGTRIARGAE